MGSLEVEIDQTAEVTRFSGVVRVDRDSKLELAKAYGLAHRGESHTQHPRHPLRHGQRFQGIHRAGDDGTSGGRRPVTRHDHPLAARR